MLASQNGHTQVVELLIKENADVKIQIKEGVTALMLASKNGHTQVVELLLKENADVTTTQITQPLDKGCFSPLKEYWQQACHDFYTNNQGRVITIYNFSVLFAKAWLSTMTASNILSAFKTTGISPFNRFAVQTIDNYYRSFKPETLIQQTGLTHIPCTVQSSLH